MSNDVKVDVAHALMRAASAIVPTQVGDQRAQRSHECERGTQECVRHGSVLQISDLGRVGYAEALALQKHLVEQRKRGLIPDQLLIVEHPHVITLGRNGHMDNLLASEEILRRAGIEFHSTDRGGDITYHGPGQVVVYPIFDLREWKRDVVAYVRALEQVIIDSLQEFGIEAGRVPGCTGAWVDGKKVAAIGVHMSRWVTSHGLALNHTTDLTYFQYIVPCGITKPVTSMRALGSNASRDQVVSALIRNFSKQFQLELISQDRVPLAAELTETF
jgi:lipoyl(octanoyl) transferase